MRIFSGTRPIASLPISITSSPAANRARVEAHLATCDRCRRDFEQIRLSRAALDQLPLTSAPNGLWTAIEAAADSARPSSRPAASLRLTYQYAAAALFLIILTSGYWISSRPTGPTWEVVALNGIPVAGDRPILGKDSVHTGESVQTDSASRARILVASIGSVVIEPDTVPSASSRPAPPSTGSPCAAAASPPSSPRLLASLSSTRLPAPQSISGASTAWSATAMAPARSASFPVGLHLNGKAANRVVPGGASCRMYPGRGPGTPSFDDASPAFLTAVDAFDRTQPGALDRLINQARIRDTLTLWHMLSRVNVADRIRVYGEKSSGWRCRLTVSRSVVACSSAKTCRRCSTARRPPDSPP